MPEVAPVVTARIPENSPRRADWIEVFGTEVLPIISPVPVVNDGPTGRREFYRLDVSRITPQQRQRLVRWLSKRWKLPVHEVEKSVDDPEHGVPLLADDLVVAADMRLFV